MEGKKTPEPIFQSDGKYQFCSTRIVASNLKKAQGRAASIFKGPSELIAIVYNT